MRVDGMMPGRKRDNKSASALALVRAKARCSAVLEIAPYYKEEGLKQFAARGYLLIDAPVNNLEDEEADAIIARDFPELVEDLRKHKGFEAGIVLVKANVCDLEPKLKDVGFNILNEGVRIPFPGTGNQGKFRTLIRKILFGHQHLAGKSTVV